MNQYGPKSNLHDKCLGRCPAPNISKTHGVKSHGVSNGEMETPGRYLRKS